MRQNTELIASISQCLGLASICLILFLLVRSSETSDKAIYVEKTLMDLEMVYGRTEAGRPEMHCYSLLSTLEGIPDQASEDAEGHTKPSEGPDRSSALNFTLLQAFSKDPRMRLFKVFKQRETKSFPDLFALLLLNCMRPGGTKNTAKTEIRGSGQPAKENPEGSDNEAKYSEGTSKTLESMMDMMRGEPEHEVTDEEDETGTGETTKKKGKGKRAKKAIC